MRQIWRYILNTATVLSLFLFATVVAVWVSSYLRYDVFTYRSGDGLRWYIVSTPEGALQLDYGRRGWPATGVRFSHSSFLSRRGYLHPSAFPGIAEPRSYNAGKETPLVWVGQIDMAYPLAAFAILPLLQACRWALRRRKKEGLDAGFPLVPGRKPPPPAAPSAATRPPTPPR